MAANSAPALEKGPGTPPGPWALCTTPSIPFAPQSSRVPCLVTQIESQCLVTGLPERSRIKCQAHFSPRLSPDGPLGFLVGLWPCQGADERVGAGEGPGLERGAPLCSGLASGTNCHEVSCNEALRSPVTQPKSGFFRALASLCHRQTTCCKDLWRRLSM